MCNTFLDKFLTIQDYGNSSSARLVSPVFPASLATGGCVRLAVWQAGGEVELEQQEEGGSAVTLTRLAGDLGPDWQLLLVATRPAARPWQFTVSAQPRPAIAVDAVELLDPAKCRAARAGYTPPRPAPAPTPAPAANSSGARSGQPSTAALQVPAWAGWAGLTTFLIAAAALVVFSLARRRRGAGVIGGEEYFGQEEGLGQGRAEQRPGDTEDFIDFTLATACSLDADNLNCEAHLTLTNRKITTI